MDPFSFELLILPTIIIFVFTLFFSLKFNIKPGISILAAILKASVYFVYFYFFFDGTFTMLDDWTYIEGGQKLLDRGVTFTNLFINWEYALMIGGGQHFLYYLINTYAFMFFGEGYYAPVALNIIITVFIAYIGAKLAKKEFFLSNKSSRIFYLFLLLHPDIFAWSNVYNGKDLVTLFFHVTLLASFSLFYKKKIFLAFAIGATSMYILFFLRFYVPLMFVSAFLVSLFIQKNIRFSTLLKYLSVALIILYLIADRGGVFRIDYALDFISEDFVNPVFGLIRAMLTPIPFNTDLSYSFLNISALIHWLLFPALLVGLIRLYRLRVNNKFITFFLCYLFLFIALYAITGELQGPRHRIQLDFGIAILQFTGLSYLLKVPTFLRKSRTSNYK